MDIIYAICTTLKAGNDYDKKKVMDYNINVGDKFTLADASVGNWHTDVKFVEIPNVEFNSVFFNFVNENNEPVNIYDMEEFNDYSLR